MQIKIGSKYFRGLLNDGSDQMKLSFFEVSVIKGFFKKVRIALILDLDKPGSRRSLWNFTIAKQELFMKDLLSFLSLDDRVELADYKDFFDSSKKCREILPFIKMILENFSKYEKIFSSQDKSAILLKFRNSVIHFEAYLLNKGIVKKKRTASKVGKAKKVEGKKAKSGKAKVEKSAKLKKSVTKRVLSRFSGKKKGFFSKLLVSEDLGAFVGTINSDELLVAFEGVSRLKSDGFWDKYSEEYFSNALSIFELDGLKLVDGTDYSKLGKGDVIASAYFSVAFRVDLLFKRLLAIKGHFDKGYFIDGDLKESIVSSLGIVKKEVIKYKGNLLKYKIAEYKKPKIGLIKKGKIRLAKVGSARKRLSSRVKRIGSKKSGKHFFVRLIESKDVFLKKPKNKDWNELLKVKLNPELGLESVGAELVRDQVKSLFDAVRVFAKNVAEVQEKLERKGPIDQKLKDLDILSDEYRDSLRASMLLDDEIVKQKKQILYLINEKIKPALGPLGFFDLKKTRKPLPTRYTFGILLQIGGLSNEEYLKNHLGKKLSGILLGHVNSLEKGMDYVIQLLQLFELTESERRSDHGESMTDVELLYSLGNEFERIKDLLVIQLGFLDKIGSAKEKVPLVEEEWEADEHFFQRLFKTDKISEGEFFSSRDYAVLSASLKKVKHGLLEIKGSYATVEGNKLNAKQRADFYTLILQQVAFVVKELEHGLHFTHSEESAAGLAAVDSSLHNLIDLMKDHPSVQYFEAKNVDPIIDALTTLEVYLKDLNTLVTTPKGKWKRMTKGKLKSFRYRSKGKNIDDHMGKIRLLLLEQLGFTHEVVDFEKGFVTKAKVWPEVHLKVEEVKVGGHRSSRVAGDFQRVLIDSSGSGSSYQVKIRQNRKVRLGRNKYVFRKDHDHFVVCNLERKEKFQLIEHGIEGEKLVSRKKGSHHAVSMLLPLPSKGPLVLEKKYAVFDFVPKKYVFMSFEGKAYQKKIGMKDLKGTFGKMSVGTRYSRYVESDLFGMFRMVAQAIGDREGRIRLSLISASNSKFGVALKQGGRYVERRGSTKVVYDGQKVQMVVLREIDPKKKLAKLVVTSGDRRKLHFFNIDLVSEEKEGKVSFDLRKLFDTTINIWSDADARYFFDE